MKAYIRPRPLRVAYLVDENEYWQVMLDAIFSESFSRWGGRFTLIVPCEKGLVRPAYIPWLETYDPDLIYSFIDLDETAVEWIHMQFGPAYLVAHEFSGKKERDHHSYRPRLPVTPLSVFSVMGLMRKDSLMGTSQITSLVDTHIATEPSPFLQQNFGCYGRSSNSWPMEEDMAEHLKTLTFVPPDIQATTNLIDRVPLFGPNAVRGIWVGLLVDGDGIRWWGRIKLLAD